MDTLIPIAGGSSPATSAGLGGGVGGFLGSWFGNMWNRGYGGFGYGDGYARPVSTALDGVNTGMNNAMMDDLSGISNQLQNLGNTILQGQSQAATTAAQGFGGLNTTVLQSANGLTTSLCATGAELAAAINRNGTDSRFATMEGFATLSNQLGNCCCTTQSALQKGFGDIALESCQNTGRIVSAIQSEGCATRNLISNYEMQNVRDQLCAANSKIAAMETEKVMIASQAAQTQALETRMQNWANAIISHVVASRHTANVNTPAA